MTSSNELMRRVQAGDETALAALMEEWELPVKRLVGRLVQNAGEAEELAQETFVRVWQQRSRFRSDAEFRPWLFSIAVNLARNRLRWWRRRPVVSLDAWMAPEYGRRPGGGKPRTEDGRQGADENLPSLGLERKERAEAVRAAVSDLPADLRESLVLFEYEELSHAEIAVALNCTAKAVETRLYRARARLRSALSGLLNESSQVS